MKLIRKALISLILAMTAATALASKDPADSAGTQDHPEIVRFPNFHLDSSKHSDYDEFAFSSKSGDQPRAGKFWSLEYVLNDGARQPSPVELIKNYENAFKKVGGSMVHREYSLLTVYRMPLANGGERWMQMNVHGDGNRYNLNIVDVKGMEQTIEFSSDQMADAIQKNGFVALNGILFDNGKAVVKTESEALIKEVATLLNKDKALKLAIVGHTDKVGDKKANLDLSKKRAESVVQKLVAAGIDVKRLKADGKGDTEPVADNRLEDGRAKNRRVELLKL